MKKALAIISALALVGSVAFADAKAGIGAWGRNIFTPAGSSATTVLGTSWAGAPRIGFTAYGSTDDIGFVADLVADPVLDSDATNNFVAFGDQQKVWVKPFSGLTLSFGNVYEDTLRGNASFGSYNWIRLTWTGDDGIFDRMISVNGLVATYTGVENLFVGAAVSTGAWGNGDDKNAISIGGSKYIVSDTGVITPVTSYTSYTSADTFKCGQYAIGYTLPSIGQIRAQYIGGKSAGKIEAAFKLNAVQNLNVDLGGKFNISTSAATVALNPYIGATASYKADALTVNFLADSTVITDSASTSKTDLELGLGADYGLDGGVTISADVRGSSLLTTAGFGGLVGVSKGFSNGKVGIGFEYSTCGFAPGAYNGTDKAAWAIPVLVEYWF